MKTFLEVAPSLSKLTHLEVLRYFISKFSFNSVCLCCLQHNFQYSKTLHWKVMLNITVFRFQNNRYFLKHFFSIHHNSLAVKCGECLRDTLKSMLHLKELE